MQNAPPVAFPVGRFAWGRLAMLLLALLSALGLAGWQILAQPSDTRVLSAWLFWSLCLGGAAYGIPKQTLGDGQLFWSSEAWFWETAAGPSGQMSSVPVNLSVALDWGAGLLLWVRLAKDTGAGHGQWVCAWPQEKAMPSKWHGFRCAVYSRPKIQLSSDATFPASL